ncbi:MAG: dicarboxylate/amino acid:cation symporter [bacterium]|nr:dicarboxylate/amino acid:cation symporter [bacterium]
MTRQNRFLLFIALAIVLGAILGGQFPQQALYIGFIGDLFLNALKMIVVPLVVVSMIVGVTNLGDIRKLGGIGRRTILYYMATTGLSVMVGLILVNLIRPGAGIKHGEDLTTATYTIQGLQVNLQNIELEDTRYDDRHQVVLKDQNVVGLIDKKNPPAPAQITVTRWTDRTTEQTVTPTSSGHGIAIDLALSDRVRGKDRAIHEVITDVIVGMIPTNIFKSMVETDVLPLIVFSLLFGGVLTILGDTARPLIELIGVLNTVIMKIVHIVITFTPLGIFALIAARMGASGGWAGFLPELVRLGWYATTVIGGLLIHGLVILPLILLLVARRNVFRFGNNMLPALGTAFSTASSSGTLPVTMESVENNGVSNRVSSFVLPLGATVNMDGTALYEAVAALFIAQVYGISLGPVEQVIIFLTATLAAIGAAGIPEAGLVTMVIVLRAVDLPVEGITLLLVIDWFLDRCRTTVNVWGDAVGAAVIARYEGETEPLQS